MLTMATCATTSRVEFALKRGQPNEGDHTTKRGERLQEGCAVDACEFHCFLCGFAT